MPAAFGVAVNSSGFGGVSGSVGRVTTSGFLAPSSFLPSFESPFLGSVFDLLDEEDGFEGGCDGDGRVVTFGATLLERINCGCAPSGTESAS
jgi:hypothetical protein